MDIDFTEICSADQFFCKKSGICISMSQKCDAKFDCKYKEDELDCCELFSEVRFKNGSILFYRGIISIDSYVDRWQLRVP